MKRTLTQLLFLVLVLTPALAQPKAQNDPVAVKVDVLENNKGGRVRIRYTIVNVTPTPVYIPRQFDVLIGLENGVSLVAHDGSGNRVNLVGDMSGTPYRCESGHVAISRKWCSTPKGSATDLNSELKTSWILLQPSQFVGGDAELPPPSRTVRGKLTYQLTYHVDLSWRYKDSAKKQLAHPVAEGTFWSNKINVEIATDGSSSLSGK